MIRLSSWNKTVKTKFSLVEERWYKETWRVVKMKIDFHPCPYVNCNVSERQSSH